MACYFRGPHPFVKASGEQLSYAALSAEVSVRSNQACCVFFICSLLEDKQAARHHAPEPQLGRFA